MTDSTFRHVSSTLLRHILSKEPKQLARGDVETALSATLDALGRDVINPDVPAAAIEKRIEAAREANAAIFRRQNTRALTALRRFWTV